MAGRLVAKSIIDNLTCDINFTKSFLKHILGIPLYVNDLYYIDEEYAD